MFADFFGHLVVTAIIKNFLIYMYDSDTFFGKFQHFEKYSMAFVFSNRRRECSFEITITNDMDFWCKTMCNQILFKNEEDIHSIYTIKKTIKHNINPKNHRIPQILQNE